MMNLTLREIAEAVGGKLLGRGDIIVSGISTDSRKYEAGSIFVALRGERFDAHDFVPTLAGVAAAILTEKEFPGFDQILVSDTLIAFGRLSAFWKARVSPEYTVGVTGSVGKTTTKDLIACVLKQKFKTHFTEGNFNNQIGVPITLIRIDQGTEALVCEMGMSDKGEIDYLSRLASPNLAVITNIGTSHMEILGSREAICDAKLEILSGMEKGSVLILDGDEPLFRTEKVKKMCEGYRVIFAGFGTHNDIYPLDIYKGNDFIAFDAISDQDEMRIRVPALGDHFIKNALYAVAVGKICGVPAEQIREGILSYAPSGLRQKIYEKNGIRVIADCYNASPESMQASLKVLGGMNAKRKIAVLGDMLELGYLSSEAHRKVGAQCVENGIDFLFTYGKESYSIMKGAHDADMPPEKTFNSIDREQIADQITKMLQPGDAVLFKASRKMKLEDVISLCSLSEKENEEENK